MKFLGRPTHYLHYPTVLSTLTTHVPSTIPVGLSLRALNTSDQTSPQENAESTDTLDMPLQFKPYDLSFKHAAELSETVIRYPRPELHCLLILPDPDLGNTLAASMFNYGQQIKRFPSNSKLHTYECHFAVSYTHLISSIPVLFTVISAILVQSSLAIPKLLIARSRIPVLSKRLDVYKRQS